MKRLWLLGLLLVACAPSVGETAFVPTPNLLLTEFNISDGQKNFYAVWVDRTRLIDKVLLLGGPTLEPPQDRSFQFWEAQKSAKFVGTPFEVWYIRRDAQSFATYLSCGAFWKPQFAVLRGISNPELTQLDQFAQNQLKLESYILEQYLEPFLEPLGYTYAEMEKHPPRINRISVLLRAPTAAELRRVRATDNALDCQVR